MRVMLTAPLKKLMMKFRVPTRVVGTLKPLVSFLEGSTVGASFSDLLKSSSRCLTQCLGVFLKTVLTSTRKKLEVRYSVVTSVVIFMMDYLSSRKKASQLLFHLKSMFGNVALLTGVRMAGTKKINITIPVNSATFPTISMFGLHIGNTINA